MAFFLTEANGSEDLAVRLYEWNADLCGAFVEVMRHVEVVFRNHLHGELARTFTAGDVPWYDQGLLEPRGVEWIGEARRRIAQRRDEETEGRIIAALLFGFWNGLFGHGYEGLWRSCLHRCFRPDGPSRRKDVAAVTERVRLFRNRVAHHERLFHLNLRSQHDDLLKLAMWAAPGARDWVLEESRVLDLIAARPA